MPSTGFYPFLPITAGGVCSSYRMCQCPQRASIHFYKISGRCNKIILVCQCPQRASIHFYDNSQRLWWHYLHSVNALNGLLSISTRWPLRRYVRLINVSMPSTGFYPFLQVQFLINQIPFWLCQCPQRASIHFCGSLSEALIVLAAES